MSNVKTVPNCPKCQTIGNVISHYKGLVTLECPKCESRWKTLSKTCPDCKQPNGFATKGPCSRCYAERHKIS